MQRIPNTLEIAAVFRLAGAQAPSAVAQHYLALVAALRPLAFGRC